MEQAEKRLQLLLKKMQDGYARHRIIFDSNREPAKFIFQEVNPVFEKITRLKAEKIIGKDVEEILIKTGNYPGALLETYRLVAKERETVITEFFSHRLQRYYEVIVFPEEEEFLSIILRDITDKYEKKERTKELGGLYNFSLLLREEETMEKTLEKLPGILPSAFQFPQLVSARVLHNNKSFSTENFKKSPWKISSGFRVFGKEAGKIEVYYMSRPDLDGEPFFKEEKLMLETISEHLGRFIEQIKAREALQENEEKLSKTLDSIGDGVIVTDTGGVITRMNPQAEKLTGWAAEESQGRLLDEVFRIFNSKTSEPVPNPVFRVLETGRVQGLANDTTIVSRDGKERQIADSAAPIKDLDNNIIGVIMVFSDITEEYRTREALRKNQEQMDAILSNSPAVIYSYRVKDNRPVISYVNDNAVNVLGFSPEEFLQDSDLWFQQVHPEDKRIFSQPVWKKMKKGKPYSFEYRFKHREGNYFWILETQNKIEDEDNLEIVSVCWDITERKRAERLIQARLNLLTFAQNNSEQKVLQKTLDEVCYILDSPIGFFHFVSSDEQELQLKAWSTKTLGSFCQLSNKSNMAYRVSEAGVWVECLRERKPVIHNDYSTLPNRKDLPSGHPQIIRELVVPIFRQGKIVAIMGIGNKPRDYSDEDIQVASYFADIAWSLVEQKQNERKIHYISFHDILTDLYNRAFLEEEMKRLDTQRQLPISIIMLDLNGLKLVNDTYGHQVGDELLKGVAEILKNSCRQEDIIARWGGDEFVILLPKTGRKSAGEVGKRIRRKSREKKVRDIPVSIALGVAAKENLNKTLADTLKEAEDYMYKQKLSESRSTRSAVLNALLKTLATKSYETEEHTRRMQKIALKIGEKLGLPESEMSRLTLLITLHDIGKINLSEELLTKKGSLTEKEWAQMKKHPETGYRIARATEEFSHVAEDILAHHEHWDGSGYPRGLKGEKIPLLARITSIADAFEIMANGRPYKKALSKKEIIEEFQRCSGKQFDPELVGIFLSSIEEMFWDENNGGSI